MSDKGWHREIEEIRRRQAMAAEMGGTERVERQRSRGKLTVRERIAALLDPGSFREWGSLAGEGRYGADGSLESFRASSCLAGRGTVDGRTVVVSADDFTIRGGSSETYHHEKNAQAETHGRRSTGSRCSGCWTARAAADRSRRSSASVRPTCPTCPGFDQVVANLGLVPVVALGLGPVAGLGAARLVASHYSVMVRGLAQMFTAGPPVVAAAGEKVTAEQLGGADLHASTGSVDDVVDSEADAFARARRFLSYLPGRAGVQPSRLECDDPADRSEPWLDEAIPRDRRWPYEIRPILEAVLDRGSAVRGRPSVGTLGRDCTRATARRHGRGHRERLRPDGRDVDCGRFTQDCAPRRARRDVRAAGRALRGRRRLHDRFAGRKSGHDPRRHARDRDHLPVHRARGAR